MGIFNKFNKFHAFGQGKQIDYVNPMRDQTGYLEKDQMNAIINAANTHRNKLFIKVLSRTGRRISEVVGQKDGKAMGLMPDHIKDNNIIHFSVLKGKRKRMGVSVVTTELKNELREYIAINQIPRDKKIFPFTRQRGFQIVRKAARDAGIYYIGTPPKPVRPHHFRHSFAVHFAKIADSPNQIVLLQRALDHASIETTMHYIRKFNIKDQTEVINRMWAE